MSLVCSTARAWVLPVLYHSVTLPTSTHISRFHRAHEVTRTTETRLPLIRSLWIGPTTRPPYAAPDTDLSYGSSAWPLTTIHRILFGATGLRTLALINLYQNDWFRFEGVLSRTLTALTLGPVHGPLILANLARCPRLEEITSVDTYMRDDEARAVACSPSMRRFRRIMPAPWAIDAAAQVPQEAVAPVHILTTGPESERVQQAIVGARQGPIVVSSCESDWNRMLYAEFISSRELYIRDQTS